MGFDREVEKKPRARGGDYKTTRTKRLNNERKEESKKPYISTISTISLPFPSFSTFQ